MATMASAPSHKRLNINWELHIRSGFCLRTVDLEDIVINLLSDHSVVAFWPGKGEMLNQFALGA